MSKSIVLEITDFLEENNFSQTPLNEDANTFVFHKYHMIKLYLYPESHKFDLYFDLKSGIYEYGDIASLFKSGHLTRAFLISKGWSEQLRSERLYPRDRRGKNTKTSGI